MKKTLLNYAFYGLVSLCAMYFVACSDEDTKYDNDIKNLQEQINSLKTLIDNVGTYVKDVKYDPATGKLTIESNNGTPTTIDLARDMPEYTLDVATDGTIILKKDGAQVSTGKVNIPDQTAPFDPTKLTLGNDNFIYYDGTKTSVSISSNAPSITVLYANDGKTIIGYTIADGKGGSASFFITDALPLQSLVFVPQAYLAGIEAMKAISVSYNVWTEKAYNTYEKAREKGEIWNAPTAASISVAPQVVAFYHLNPGSVTKKQIKKIECISEDYEYISRTAASKPKVKSWEVAGDGTLKVTFEVNAALIKAIDSADDLVTALAIQAYVDFNADETTVTSDYAAIYKENWKNFVIALKDKQDEVAGKIVSSAVFAGKQQPATYHNGLNQRHLFGADNYTDQAYDVDKSTVLGTFSYQGDNNATIPYNKIAGLAQVAIELPADYSLAYDDKDGLNLKEKLTVHYISQLDKTGATEKGEFELSAKELEAYGLKYVFTKSDYIQGSNNTHQNDFFNLTEDGVMTAKVFSSGGGTAAVDREPLVRVDLVDTHNNKVVNSGWIKIKITKESPSGAEIVKEFKEFAVNCSDIEHKTTVEDMNVLIYNALGYSKTEFHKLYTLKTQGNPGTPAILKTGDYGTVVENINGNPTETNLLLWTITNADMEKVIADKQNKDNVLTATITYEANGLPDVTVTLKAKVFEPTATMVEKIDEYWNDAFTVTYVNTEVPFTLTNNGDFYADIDNSFVNNLPVFTITPADVVKTYPNDYDWSKGFMKYYYQFENKAFNFKGTSGTTYNLSIDNSAVDPTVTAANQSYSYLLAKSGAVTQLVATIDTYTGIIEYNNGLGELTGYGKDQDVTPTSNVTRETVSYMGTATITYPDNDFANDLLNVVEAKINGAGMLNAPVETILYNECRNIPVTNGKFVVSFYRPVNASGAEGKQFIDSQNAGNKLNYADLVTLTDWRLGVGATGYWNGNKHFGTIDLSKLEAQNSITWANYWLYYDVMSMTLDIANVTTTMNGGTLGKTLLSDITKQVYLKDVQTSPAVREPYNAVDYGHILYTNNGSALVKEFKLRLPITVEYRWGKLTVSVDVTVVP